MNHDTKVKRAMFIDKSSEVRNMFSWASPPEILRALNIYCSSFYGFMLWDLGGEAASHIYSAWNTAVKLAWNCPRYTKMFLLQQVLSHGVKTAKTNIFSRYGKFIASLRLSVSR